MAEKEAPVADPNPAGGEAPPTPAVPSPAAQGADPGDADPGAGGQGGEETSLSASGDAPLVPPAAGAEGEAPKPKEDWREAKIRRLTAQLHELRDKPAAEPPAPDPAGPTPEERLNAAEIERRADELARSRMAINTFNQACRDTVAAGRQSFPDFDTRTGALREAFSGGEGDTQQQVVYNQFIAAAIETGSAPAILHTLGGDLDEAARIMALPLVKMTVELTRLAGKAPDTSTTRAPKPIVPVGSRGAQHTAIAPDDPERADNLSTAEWMKRRNAQDTERNAARGRR